MKSIRNTRRARIGIATVGVGILTALGTGVATADTEDSVDVSVDIAANAEPGSLALTVASDTTTLAEGNSTPTDRVFTGTLPTVTVTDTRPAGTVIDPAVLWYVMGSVTDFTGDADQPAIKAVDGFGWEPAVVQGSPDDVAPGPVVQPGEGGFAEQSYELLYNTDSTAETGPGAWTANAELTLQTPLDVAHGKYAATMTLSLFEDDGS